ncbi:hypothetical protein M0804_003500 [Polistes exclamans]|nr:hypothetical protein M0804_003500 [Polistes exclamans]
MLLFAPPKPTLTSPSNPPLLRPVISVNQGTCKSHPSYLLTVSPPAVLQDDDWWWYGGGGGDGGTSIHSKGPYPLRTKLK